MSPLVQRWARRIYDKRFDGEESVKTASETYAVLRNSPSIISWLSNVPSAKREQNVRRNASTFIAPLPAKLPAPKSV